MKTWVMPAVLIIAVEYIFALTVGTKIGFDYKNPFTSYMVVALAAAGLGTCAIVLAKMASYAHQGERSPARRLMRELTFLPSFVVGVILGALQIAVLTWTKIMLPIASPFWADGALANFDHALLGNDTWMLAERLFGWAAKAIDSAYVTWAPAKYGTFIFLILASESNRKSRALIAYFIMMAATVFGQYVLSSAGPVFYERLGLGSRFTAIPMEPWVTDVSAYLWKDHVTLGGDIGGGISAMPSLHVAAALWIALVLASYDRWAGLFGAVYFALILIGSVLLGWHYAADGMVAIAITCCAWSLASLYVRGAARSVPGGGLLSTSPKDIVQRTGQTS